MSEIVKHSRRAALTALAGASVLAIPAVAVAAAVPPDADAELVALAAEIERLCAVGEEVHAKRIEPFQETFQILIDDGLLAVKRDPAGCKEHSAPAWAYSRESGREAAVKERADLDEQADRLWERMMTIPAATSAGRAAKVRALLVAGFNQFERF
jgi:hypothetical protein